MKKYKKYSLTFLYIISIIILFHIIVWNIYTKYVFPENYIIGDLGRISYKLDSLLPRKNINTLSRKHLDFKYWNSQKIDVLTIGDSFSNGGGGGKNPFYQDYLSTKYNINVLNIQNILPSNNYLEMIYLLNNSKLLDKINPKVIILQTTERNVLAQFSIPNINSKINLRIDRLELLLSKKLWNHDKPDIKIINNLNYNAMLYNLLYKFDDNAFLSKCYISVLNSNLFSSKNTNTLLFHSSTLSYNSSITKNKIILLNENINKLTQVLNTKGISLYFMPSVDKYNLYSKYIINNNYKKSNFFEELRKMKKIYTLIDTKKILEKELNKGIKDIFYPDDTHWSYKASEAIANNLKEFK